MKLRHFGIILLSLLSIFGVYDVTGTDASVITIIVYLFTYFLVAVFLYMLSLSSKKKNEGALRVLDYIGLVVSSAIVVMSIFYFIWDMIRQ